MRPSARALSFAIVAAWAAAVAARAEPGAVLVGGKASEHAQAVAAEAVSRVVRAAGWQLGGAIARADGVAAAACLRGAEPWPCIARAVRDRVVQRVAAVSLDAEPGRDGGVTLVITERVALAGAAAALVGQRFCDHCTDDTLGALAGELTQELLDRAAVSSGRTVLAVRSTPQGAQFQLDGAPAGATDALIDVLPGSHTVTIEREGYEPATRIVDAVEGRTAEVAVTLRAVERAAPHTGVGSGSAAAGSAAGSAVDPPHASRTAPIAVTAAGSALLVAGLVVLALDESPAADPTRRQSPHYTDTTAPGIGLAVTGAVVAGVGGYLWWRATHSTVAPIVAPAPGGAVVGLSHTF